MRTEASQRFASYAVLGAWLVFSPCIAAAEDATAAQRAADEGVSFFEK
jgi:hypothetical protein